MDSATRFPVPDAPRVGIVRGLPHTWEVNELGGAVAKNPDARSQRVNLIRQGTVALSLAPDAPTLDLSDDNAKAAYWTRATS